MQMPVTAPVREAESATQVLSEFLSSIHYEALPENVVARTEELFLDWLASALAGRTSH